ncbi:MAG: mechanosensitive ion channel family protein [Opitutaceae bacterium]|nr:mechanosensitive ion channel family protein [Opitutaceae bacterium]
MSTRASRLPVFFLILWCAAVAPLSADVAAPEAKVADAVVSENKLQAEEPAAVHVFNRPIFVARATLLDESPESRARSVEERVGKLIREGVYGPVTTSRRTEGVAVLVDSRLAFMLQPADVDPAAGLGFDEAVAEAVGFLEEALAAARHQRSPAFLLEAAIKTLAATVIFGAAIWMLLVLHQRVRPQISRHLKRSAARLIARGFSFTGQLLLGLLGLVGLLRWFVVLGLVAQWLTLCLGWFPYTRPWGQVLGEQLSQALAGVFEAIMSAVPDLLVIAVVVVLTRGALVVLKGFFSGVESGRVRVEWMNVEAARATRRIVTVIVWLFAIVMIYPYIPGSSSDAFKGMSVFVGLLFSLGSSSVIGQFTSGLVLMYSKALRSGEYVNIGDREGTVESLGFLSTKICSPKNEEFHIPNTVILATTIKNYSRLAGTGGLYASTCVTIGYDTPWRQVHALLLEAARRTPGLLAEPPPFVLQRALSDFYVEYEINASIAVPGRRLRVLSDLHAHIQDQFNTHGVQIMSPHYMRDKERPVVVPRERWFAAPAAPDVPAMRAYGAFGKDSEVATGAREAAKSSAE